MRSSALLSGFFMCERSKSPLSHLFFGAVAGEGRLGNLIILPYHPAILSGGTNFYARDI
jgi:hypothetical protein